MNRIFSLLLLLLPGSFVLLGLFWVVHCLLGRRRALRRRLGVVYLRTLLAVCCGRTRYSLPLIHRPGARLALADAVAGVRRTVADCDLRMLRSVVRCYDLERLLLRRLRLPWAREESLRLLATLPIGPLSASRLARMRPPYRRMERFYRLLARMNASPNEVVPLLRRFGEPFTTFEQRTLLSLVVRGALTLPCGELLRAHEENLRRLGLRMVRHFNLLREIPRVQALVSDLRVGGEALMTLCDLGVPLAAGDGTLRLNEAERRALLRRAAYAGYTLRGVESLLRGEERCDFERLAATYKSPELWS